MSQSGSPAFHSHWEHDICQKSGLQNENGLLDSPEAPLEQAYLHTNLVANAGEGWESNWAAKTNIA